MPIEFFIRRPVFTSVCSLILLLAGAVAIPTLPIAQYPDISPRQVSVEATFTGADAQTVEETVTAPLEEEINGAEGLQYLSSSSTNNGVSAITATFEPGHDQDLATVDVQNRVATAEPRLPESVRQTGVTVSKSSGSPLLGFGLYSQDGRYDTLFLSNYADRYLIDALQQIDGVGSVQIFGNRTYAMRLWLDPQQLASRNLTAQDVAEALQQQNLQVGAGQIGQPPTSAEQPYQLSVRASGRLEDASAFENLTLKTTDGGTRVQLKDVGRAELGSQTYNSFFRFRGNEAVGLGIFPVPDSNALEVGRAVKARMQALSQAFPAGMRYEVGFDTTDFIQQSLLGVVGTLVQALALVVLVIFVFLQDWRNTLIPAITIPVALIGTFAFIQAFNFSINSLTLFGLTLAIGLVVDDAIIVVENVSRKVQQQGLRARPAAIAAMRELSGAVVATSLVLMAVFVPVAFFPGTTGALYRQFALTIAFAIALSTFNALTLTPALSALLLRPHAAAQGWLGRALDAFNRGLDALQARYRQLLNRLMRAKTLVISVFVALLGVTGWVYLSVPSAFLPQEDQGYFITIVQGPQGSTLDDTRQVMRQLEERYLSVPEVRATVAVGGFNLGGGSTVNSGVVFTTLAPWSERSQPSQSVGAIIGRLRGQLAQIAGANIVPVNPPAIQGLGNFGGFTFQLQDRRGNLSLDALVRNKNALLKAANQHPKLQQVFSTYAASAPQLQVEVNRSRANALGIPISDIYSTLQTYVGSRYVNDFTLARQNYRVYLQAEAQFRDEPKDLSAFYVRSRSGRMVSLDSLINTRSTSGAQTINHYNTFRTIELSGGPAPGASSGEAIAAMEQLAAETLPPGLGYEWSGLSREQIQSAGQAPLIFGLGLAFVFLVLAAQYESYVDPAIIMLSVPLAILGALLALWLRGIPNDVYGQIGLVMLIGLASKNAILIVEFANQLRAQGRTIAQAALEAAQQRMRPIIMTAISTLGSILPLVVASGAGSASRQSLGTAVFGGMLVATFLTLLVAPVMYVAVKSLAARAFGSGQAHYYGEN